MLRHEWRGTPPRKNQINRKKRFIPARGEHDNLPRWEYAARFLARFGAAIGRPVVHRDPVGASLVISEVLFQTAAGEWKVMKGDRHRYTLLLADTIRDPDEIWMHWQEMQNRPGASRLVRRYIRAFEVDETQQFGLGVFELSDDGWTGVTLFAPSPARSDEARCAYFEQQRAGTLVYRREDGR